MNAPLYINAWGLINPLGENCAEVAENLFKGSQQGFVLRDDLLHLDTIQVGQISCELPALNDFPLHFQSRNNQIAYHAYQQIGEMVEQLKKHYPIERIGVILGTSTSGIAQGEEAMKAKQGQGGFPENYHYRQQEMSNVAEFICHLAKLSGFALTISTACSSGGKTFVTAGDMIHAGLLDAAIVGGVDSLCGMTVNGFSALESTSAGICQPSSINRDGINIGESAALAVLSKNKSHLRFLAGGESSDAHHMSAPHPEGQGAIDAMRQALEKAQLDPKQIDYINLHGTATPKNDLMEAIAVSSLFPHQPFVSSSKGNVGHTLGAAGATELAFCCLVLEQQKLAPHVWDKMADPAIPQLNWVDDVNAITKPIQYCLSNSFAFGGNNVSLIIGLESE